MSGKSDKPIVIVGGGIAGLGVAKVLAENNIECAIVEKSDRIGGNVRNWACMASSQCLRCFCCKGEDLADDVRSSPNVKIWRGREVVSVIHSPDGVVEKVRLRSVYDRAEGELDASAVVVAVGFEPYDPQEKVLLGYGRLDGVMTLADLDSLVKKDDLRSLTRGTPDPLKVAFIQCVGSRDASIGAAYCSQYCCAGALRMALRLLNDHPDWETTIFYIDLQVAGKFAGPLLSMARDRKVRLVQGVPGEVIPAEDGLLELVTEQDGRNVRERFHRIVLSIGQRPAIDTRDVCALTGLKTDQFGFLSPKGLLDSSRTDVPGIYLAGTCSGPKNIEATLAHAGQTASAIMSDLLSLPD
jgi:heterodisulfide reductase subunit A2